MGPECIFVNRNNSTFSALSEINFLYASSLGIHRYFLRELPFHNGEANRNLPSSYDRLQCSDGYIKPVNYNLKSELTIKIQLKVALTQQHIELEKTIYTHTHVLFVDLAYDFYSKLTTQ